MVPVCVEEIMRIICEYGLQEGRSDCEKDNFIMKYRVRGNYKIPVKQFLVWVILTDMQGNGVMILRANGG